MTSLTEIAHRESNAQKTDIVIDATAGNGHDTLFLAQRVGPYGKVYAFDIQQAALDQTAARLAEVGMNNVRLIHDDHANMLSVVEPRHHGRISAVMFNLGYLPGGDRSIITKPSSTIAAIRAAIQLLRDGGKITILAYPGHPGGLEERAAVERLLAEVTPALMVKWYTGEEGTRISPKLLVITRMETDLPARERPETP